ncbi:SubName: Full=Uncharacterized protein {ECO:0000313/EMBL:CCA73804.1} [Serendipita indica DSM 11827]|nr:SubName: Full=Uncharacterized protein {ECO:0000313/EMBL:CCA73804.1} [Serendipita indica DSM 11827]
MPPKRTLPSTTTIVGSSGLPTRSRHRGATPRGPTAPGVPYVHLDAVERRSSRAAAARDQVDEARLLPWFYSCSSEPSAVEISSIADEMKMSVAAVQDWVNARQARKPTSSAQNPMSSSSNSRSGSSRAVSSARSTPVATSGGASVGGLSPILESAQPLEVDQMTGGVSLPTAGQKVKAKRMTSSQTEKLGKWYAQIVGSEQRLPSPEEWAAISAIVNKSVDKVQRNCKRNGHVYIADYSPPATLVTRRSQGVIGVDVTTFASTTTTVTRSSAAAPATSSSAESGGKVVRKQTTPSRVAPYSTDPTTRKKSTKKYATSKTKKNSAVTDATPLPKPRKAKAVILVVHTPPSSSTPHTSSVDLAHEEYHAAGFGPHPTPQSSREPNSRPPSSLPIPPRISYAPIPASLPFLPRPAPQYIPPQYDMALILASMAGKTTFSTSSIRDTLSPPTSSKKGNTSRPVRITGLIPSKPTVSDADIWSYRLSHP